MDWLRRNWPDLLIGIALIAVVSGIVVTLLGGGSFLPGPGRQASEPTLTQSQQETRDPPEVIDTEAEPAPPTQPEVAQDDEPDEVPEVGGIEPVIPDLPSLGGSTPAPSTPTESADADTETATAPSPSQASPTTAETTTPTPAPSPTTSTAPSGSTAGLNQASYRISVGAFSSSANAERLADQVRGQGFPVFTAAQGNFTVVLVGPYGSSSEAQQARQQLASQGHDTNVYFFDPNGSGSGTQVATTPETPATPVAASTTEGGRYIQVGAYVSSQGAAPQRNRMEELGYSVTEREEGGLIRLLIGPFGEGELSQVREQLSARGIDHFVR